MVSAMAVLTYDDQPRLARLPRKRKPTGTRRSPHAQIRDGVRVANLKALTAGEFYLGKVARKESVTLREAALRHGTNVAYLRAAITVIKARDQEWIDRLLRGDGYPIVAAAKFLEPQVKAIEALKAAGSANLRAIYASTGFTNKLAKLLADSPPAARTSAARYFGRPDVIWDEMVVPTISPNAAE
jgi:hypothetical protein